MGSRVAVAVEQRPGEISYGVYLGTYYLGCSPGRIQTSKQKEERGGER